MIQHFFLQIKNFEKNIEKFKNNEHGKKIQKIDLISTAQKIELPAETIEKLNSLKKIFNSKVNQKVFYNFFGKNFSLALVSVDIENIDAKKINPEIINAAILIEPKTNAKFSQIMSEAIPDIEKKRILIINQ